MSSYCLYWCHLEEHTDPFTQGYIGITKHLKERIQQHFRNDNKLDDEFQKAINSYGKEKIKVTVLKSSLDKDIAYNFERHYRPENNIGWNTSKGGAWSDSCVKGKAVTLFNASNPEVEYSFNSYNEAAEVLGVTYSRISQAARRKSNTYGRDGWTVKSENTDKSTIKTVNDLARENMLGKSHPSKFKGTTGRWTEEQKAKIGSYHKGKEISEKQRETVRAKNRANHPSCRQLTLVHKSNPDKQYTYHSISEASRQLGLPLARLKSKVQRTLGRYGDDGWAVIAYGGHLSSNDTQEQKAQFRFTGM